MNWLSDILPEAALTLVGGFSGWFFGRNRQKAHTKSVELENVQSAIAIWRESAESLAEEMEKVKLNQDEIIKKNKELTAHVEKLERQVLDLTAENKELRQSLDRKA